MGRNKIIEERDNGIQVTEVVEEAGTQRLISRKVYQKGTPEYEERIKALGVL